MSWEATAYVNQLEVKLTRSEKLLLLVLANYHNKEQDAAWPSHDALGRDALMSMRHVIRLVESLERRGILQVAHQRGRKHSNRYKFPGLSSDKMSPLRNSDTVSHFDEGKYDISDTKYDISRVKCDIAMSPEPINRTDTIEPTREDSAYAPNGASAGGRRAADPYFEAFARCFEAAYSVPYTSKAADFVQLASLKKRLGSVLNPDRWETALVNYFASPQGVHTLGDISARFATFQKWALDRFGKPVSTNTIGTALSSIEQFNLSTRDAIRRESQSGQAKRIK